MAQPTITILCHKRKLSFFNHGTWDDTKQKYVGGNTEHVDIDPKPSIQTVPAWIKNDNTFKEAVKAGLIVEIQVVAQPVEVPASALPAEQTVIEEAEPVVAGGGKKKK